MPSYRVLLQFGIPAFAVVALLKVASLGQNDGPRLRRRLLGETGNGAQSVQLPRTTQKPVMYTFYHEFNGAEGSGTGMTSETDQVLLKIWKGEWAAAGWIPRVLTLEDARQHPHFRTLDTMLNGLPFKMYDRLCFLRWLAMANQPGGGFLADYDTFPLSWIADKLPNDGRLTVYEFTESGGVPSLLSANENEWFRFAWALVENAVSHQHESHWSDMKAIQDIYQQSGHEAYVMTNGVLPGTAVLHGRGYPEDTCDRASSAFAVHFSHYSVDKGILPEGIPSGPQARAPVAEEWLKGWRKNCAVQVIQQQLQQQQLQQPITLSFSDGSLASGSLVSEPPLVLESATAPVAGKPIIFTFYEHADDSLRTGMSPEDDYELIQAWARSWYEIGWDPRVLDISVARGHPEFALYDGYLQQLPFNRVERICFYRYLAMGMVGGGWLSDFDTFPLNAATFSATGDPSFLPNSGELTVHEQSDAGGVPSLVSGNAAEWYRLAKAQVENALAHRAESHWSDAKALQDLFQQSGGSFYKMGDNVVMGFTVLRDAVISREACIRLQGKLAIHFSHSSMHLSGRWQSGADGAKHRAPVGRNWLLQYRQACAQYDSTN